MKAKINFELNESSDENAIEICLKSGETFDEYLTFLKEAIRVNIQTDDDEHYLLTSDTIELDLMLLHSLVEMITSKYMIHSPALLDENMNPIPKLKKGGQIHRLQHPSPAEELKK